VADVYDALVSKRCYKDAYSKEQAFKMILNGECGVFSDRILQCFIDSREELEALYA
jgi:putative two-component system response regulator